jgi:RNA polymerase sigma-70 factor (ECF subfamily)
MTPPLLPDERTDAELIEAFRSGDASAFAEVFRRHKDRVWAVTLRTLRNPADAADVAQEVFLKAMRSVDSFRGDAAVTTWLHRIAVNACLDHLRAGSRRPTDPLGDDSTRIASPRDDFAQSDTEMAVRDALLQLPEEQRLAIVLVDLEGMSVADAAVMLEVAAGTVKSRCSRGRTQLASLLSSLAPGNPAAEGGVPSRGRTTRTRGGAR